MMDLAIEHWPFIAVAIVFWIVGHFVETSVFTKARALRHWTWEWARESMELHPIIAGVLVGLVWTDPIGKEWGDAASIAYFGFAGACSMGVWLVLSLVLERLGVKGSLRFPGESIPPER